MANPEKYRHIDFKPPKSVAEAAERGLEYRAKANPSDKGGLTPAEAGEQGIGSGVQRATNLKNRTECSPDVIRQMCAFFARHEKNKGIKPENKSTPWKQKGHVAWLLWGGDPGRSWAEKVRDQMDRADEKADKTATSMLERVAITYEKRRELEQEYRDELRSDRAQRSDLVALAELASFLKDPKSSSFLSQMAESHRLPTEKQQAYIEVLRRKYGPKLPMLDKLRADAEREREKAQREREEAERQMAQEAKELADLGRELRHEGWREDKSWSGMGYYYEEAPYGVEVTPLVDDYDRIDTWVVVVSKDSKTIFQKNYRVSLRTQIAETAEFAKDTAMGVIEKDKRQSAKVAPVEVLAPPPAKPSDSKEELIAKVKKLGDAAVAASDEWVGNFTKSILFQLSKGKTLSEKQTAVLDKNFKKYKVAGQAQPTHDELVRFLKSIRTYMDFEQESDSLYLTTRETGDVENERPGSRDIAEAKRVRQIIQDKYPRLPVQSDTTGEWVTLKISLPYRMARTERVASRYLSERHG